MHRIYLHNYTETYSYMYCSIYRIYGHNFIIISILVTVTILVEYYSSGSCRLGTVAFNQMAAFQMSMLLKM